jgi:hypothetical protein
MRENRDCRSRSLNAARERKFDAVLSLTNGSCLCRSIQSLGLEKDFHRFWRRINRIWNRVNSKKKEIFQKQISKSIWHFCFL